MSIVCAPCGVHTSLPTTYALVVLIWIWRQTEQSVRTAVTTTIKRRRKTRRDDSSVGCVKGVCIRYVVWWVLAAVTYTLGLRLGQQGRQARIRRGILLAHGGLSLV